jgi:hypothetical protein
LNNYNGVLTLCASLEHPRESAARVASRMAELRDGGNMVGLATLDISIVPQELLGWVVGGVCWGGIFPFRPL